MDEDKALSLPTKPSASGQPKATVKKEEKKRRKRMPSISSNADAEDKKKRVAVRVRKCNKKGT